MPTHSFPELVAFLAIARRRSFRRAAVDLRVSPSALSHSLRQLEERLSLKLVNRTTRSVALTEAGQRLLDQLGPAFDGIDRAVEDLNRFRDAPHGTLRINAPRQAMRLGLGAVIAEFVLRHPGMRVEVAGSDQLDDVVADGFGAGVRHGQLIAEDMIATPVGPWLGYAAFATPGYLASRAAPRHPADLDDHASVAYRFPSGKPFRWRFRRGNETIEVEPPRTALTFDDMDLVLDATLAGVGVGYMFEAQARAHAEAGRLVELLPDWRPAPIRFFLYYPGRAHLSFGLRALIDFVREQNRWIDEPNSTPRAKSSV
ncbi:LysR family transcriptional regulator [Methylopila sp. M107]|uniref:LysR family transcriptional regulator n=1 Tax=Methylopila sp. M107 TaxID=1101190 RepID=UPI000378F243|nr:LysR family transcriptional regulator [Methylopila sp. M107]